MSPWEAVPFILIGVLVVLLPVGVIGVFASRLQERQKTAFLVLYAGAVILLGIVAADVTGVVSHRPVVDLALVVGGLAVGVYAGLFLRNHRKSGPPGR
ncbi:MAG: hypothetical protein WD036_08590 [Bauldia sp.]